MFAQVSAQGITIFNHLRGSASIHIHDTGLNITGSIQTFGLGWLQIGGHDGRGPARLSIVMMEGHDNHFLLDASIRLLRVTMMCYIEITDSSLELAIAFVTGVFDFTMHALARGENLMSPTDFEVDAEMNNEALKFVSRKVQSLYKVAQAEYHEAFGKATGELTRFQNEVRSLDRLIDERQRELDRAQSSVRRELQSAQAAVEGAKADVRGLDNRIDRLKEKIRDLRWYESYKAIGYGVELGALYTAKGVALAALEVALLTLKGTEATAVFAVDRLDPHLNSLIVARSTALTMLDGAKAVLVGVERMLDGIGSIITWVADEEKLVFFPEHIRIRGSLKKLRESAESNLVVDAWIVGMHVEFEIVSALDDPSKIASAVWLLIASAFTPMGTLNLAAFAARKFIQK
eukprot:c18486_g1_i2.p1 GENE.c18486_g1_i2~~c18486_g1_i2.p1  ORF type:complete len:404 (-),score=130.08 c18486_g1_i2:88-1299(-)